MLVTVGIAGEVADTGFTEDGEKILAPGLSLNSYKKSYVRKKRSN